MLVVTMGMRLDGNQHGKMALSPEGHCWLEALHKWLWARGCGLGLQLKAAGCRLGARGCGAVG